MAKKIFIGIDGGGTHCRLKMEDQAGNLLAETKGGPANIRLSTEITWKSINHALMTALQTAQIDMHAKDVELYAGLGLAGCEAKSAVATFLANSHIFKALYLESDAYTACLGAHAGQDGAIIIIGTGVVGMQIEGTQITRVAGWGFPHSDEGSGAWLGLELMRLTLQWLDKRIPGSALLVAIFAHFNNNMDELVEWTVNANSTAFAAISPYVVKYANQEDEYAVKLMQQAGNYINDVAAALKKQAINKKLPCSLMGGLANYIQPWLSADTQVLLKSPQFDAATGALLMVKKHVL